MCVNVRKITQNVGFKYSLLPPETLKTRVKQKFGSTGENLQDVVTSSLCMYEYWKTPSWLIWHVCAVRTQGLFLSYSSVNHSRCVLCISTGVCLTVLSILTLKYFTPL